MAQKWDVPSEFPPASLAVAFRKPDLYLLADHSETRKIANDRHEITRNEIIAKNGYHAELSCLSKDSKSPERLFLKFENSNGCPPTAGTKRDFHGSPQTSPTAWMFFAGDSLFLGREMSAGISSILDSTAANYHAGIWMLPVSELDSAIIAQKQIILSEQAQQAAEIAQFQKNFLAKYDLNHDGVLDESEKEKAAGDPGYTRFMINLLHAEKARESSP